MQAQDKSELLARWLEGVLSQQEQEQFEQLRKSDAEFAQRVSSCEQMNLLSESFQDYDVPDWDRESTISKNKKSKDEQPKDDKTPWWQWSGLPIVSMSCSAAAICMVLFNLQVQVKEGTVVIGFANSYSDADIAALVDEKVKEVSALSNQENAQILAQYQQQLQQQQQQFSTQLADYILTSNRTERKEDFAELIKFVNEQRNDDQVYYARQLSLLEENLSQDNFEE